ncbi:NADAR domain-containing protein [Wenzhouxiangella marina]|nr:NADAR domain-containing protein [Wenzhouxiangella marina]MBB6087099.1 type I restriction enzyme S subunit [Wenzhouxiangella marina]
MSADQTRTYRREECIVFLKTDEPFGGLSNMAGGFPLCVNGLEIRTSEALYQACRFPHLPEVQKLIIVQKSPMTAKMKSKPHRKHSRPDWDRVRVKIMRWCLRVKLAQNWATFSTLLQETGDRPIVEESRKDAFWGAKPVDADTLVGMNVLGRLLMELRAAIEGEGREALLKVDSLDIPGFRLAGHPIETVIAENPAMAPTEPLDQSPRPGEASSPREYQPSLFDSPKGPDTMVRDSAAEQHARAGIASLKPYPALKDSGVPWLGEVPEHWEVRKLRHVLRRRTERNRPDLPLLSVVREKGVIRRDTTSADENHNYIPDDLTNYKVVRPGQFAMNKMKAWQGSYGVSRYDGIVSPAYFVFDLWGVDGNFFHAAIRSRAYVPQFTRASDGVRIGQWDLAESRMREIPFLVPPLPEQAAIVRFLDHADRRIRRYVRAKQKLIKLLEEQKQAIIHRAVTRGLDPNVRLKPSGVEWVGEVPAHWEVLRLKSLISRLDQGVSPQAENRVAEAGSWGVLKAGCVNRGVFREKEHKRLPEGFIFDEKLAISEGDVLVSRASGSPHLVGSVGRVAELTSNLILSDKIFRPVFVPNARPEYMVLAMNSRYYRLQVEQAISGAEGLANNLPSSSLRRFVFAVPPVKEQLDIAESLRSAIDDVSATVERSEREIELLNEFRTRLFADAVTGKLDVREAAAKLPDLEENPGMAEPLDELAAGEAAEFDDELDVEAEEAGA